MTRFTRQLCGILLLASVVAISGCGNYAPGPFDALLSGHLGDNCTVYFRRDAQGMAAPSPSSPLTGNHNGADTQVSGKLSQVNAEWVVLRGDGKREFHIPKSVILLVEVTAK